MRPDGDAPRTLGGLGDLCGSIPGFGGQDANSAGHLTWPHAASRPRCFGGRRSTFIVGRSHSSRSVLHDERIRRIHDVRFSIRSTNSTILSCRTGRVRCAAIQNPLLCVPGTPPTAPVADGRFRVRLRPGSKVGFFNSPNVPGFPRNPETPVDPAKSGFRLLSRFSVRYFPGAGGWPKIVPSANFHPVSGDA